MWPSSMASLRHACIPSCPFLLHTEAHKPRRVPARPLAGRAHACPRQQEAPHSPGAEAGVRGGAAGEPPCLDACSPAGAAAVRRTSARQGHPPPCLTPPCDPPSSPVALPCVLQATLKSRGAVTPAEINSSPKARPPCHSHLPLPPAYSRLPLPPATPSRAFSAAAARWCCRASGACCLTPLCFPL